MEMSFDTSETGIEWGDYGVSSMSSGHNADAAQQAAWFNALMDQLNDEMRFPQISSSNWFPKK